MIYPQEGEPTEAEIQERSDLHLMYGRDHLAIKKTCPACGGTDAEWVRQEWAICYDCMIAFNAFEEYIEPTPPWLEYIEEGETEGE